VTIMAAGAASLVGVGKRYTKYDDTPTLVYGLLHAWGKSKRSKLWAVREIDLEIAPGEAVGIVGKNGSGKSTLLQMLCGVTSPTTGELHVGGRIAPLISVGVGFHPELTGRENIFVNGTILGLKRADVARRLDEIIAFAEIESFIDTPVKFYSSGMYVRLGFSVAAHVDPNVLLIDEVLAVGDLGFQLKCYRHMEQLRRTGTTIVIVSHNLPALERHCQRGVVLRQGEKTFDGTMTEAVAHYYATLSEELGEGSGGGGELPLEKGALDILSFEILGADGNPTWRPSSQETLRIRLQVRAHADINAPFLMLALFSGDGVCIYREHNMFTPYPAMSTGQVTTFEARVRLTVATGTYTLESMVGRGNPHSLEPILLQDDVAALTQPHRVPIYVAGRANADGIADLPTDFRVGT